MRGGKKYLWERNYDENGYKEILYYEGGQKKSEGNHKKDGALDGRWVEYYPDGRIQKEGSYKDGKQAGKWTELYLLRLELTVVSYPTAAGFDVFTATWSKRFS